MIITTATLEAWQEEVFQWCMAKGWYDKPVTHNEAMALLHSEATEALEAWRDWELADATQQHFCKNGYCEPVCSRPGKPEGVGSEFADIMIRMLDDARRFGIDIAVPGFGIYIPVSDLFVENINMLHDNISQISMAAAVNRGLRYSVLLGLLLKLCAVYGIDLETEYKRKMAYNYTRPYRHGRRGAI